MAENIHKDHRKRMRERAMREDCASFSDHELFEMLLYYSIPRIDTNGIAHALMEEFGAVKGVLCAKTDELCRVPGIGENSAILIRLCVELMKRYERDCTEKNVFYRHISQIAAYFARFFRGISVERVYIMLFNNSMKMIDFVFLAEGDVNNTEASIRRITERVLNKKASSVVIAHNHPNGEALPSSSDLEYTDLLNHHLKVLGVVLLEHLVFADFEYFPIMKSHCGEYRMSPIIDQKTNSRKMDAAFYKKFYDCGDGIAKIPMHFYQPEE